MKLRSHNPAWLIAGLAIACTANGSASAQDWHSITMQRRFAGEESLRIDVEYGAGRLNISPGTGNSLFRATLRYDGNIFRPVNRYDPQQRHLRIGVDGGSIKGGNLKSGRLDLALGPGTPLDLFVKFGAAQAELELGGLRVREASIETGASETQLRVSKPNPERCSSGRFQMGAARFEATGLGNLNCEHISVSGGVGEVILDFSGDLRADASLDVDMGLGSLTLRVPQGLGISVRKSGVLAPFDSEGLIKRGNVYYSENFQNARRKLTVTIDAALGAIKVQWLDSDLSGL